MPNVLAASTRRAGSYRRMVSSLLLCCCIGQGRADTGASVPYMPSVSARHHLQRLADEAGLAMVGMQWPLPSRAVGEALDALPPDLSPSLLDARDAVRGELERLGQAELGLGLRRRRDALVGFGDSPVPGSRAALRSALLEAGAESTPWLAGRLGLSVEEEADPPGSTPARLDDSALVLQLGGSNLQVFARSHWWGPGWQSSLVLGNNTPQWMGVGLQRSSTRSSRSRWLSWLGPWNLDLFLARAHDPEVVSGQPRRFLFSAARVAFKPRRWIEIGLSRSFQLEGEGRPQGGHNYLRAWSGRGTNADNEDESADDPGNQMAGYDLRLSAGPGLRVAAYLQVVGEDEAGFLPSKSLLLAGAETWTADGEHRFFAEYASSYCSSLPGQQRLPRCAYLNHQYPQGYTNGARWAGASQGPDSRLLSLGWLSASGARLLRLHHGRVGVSLGSYRPRAEDPPRGRLTAFSAQQTFILAGLRLTPGFAWTRLDQAPGLERGRRVLAHWGVQADWTMP